MFYTSRSYSLTIGLNAIPDAFSTQQKASVDNIIYGIIILREIMKKYIDQYIEEYYEKLTMRIRNSKVF